jgi:hypothetical protein
MVAWGRILLNPVMKYQPRSLKIRQPPPLASTIQTILISEQYEVAIRAIELGSTERNLRVGSIPTSACNPNRGFISGCFHHQHEF